MTSASDETSPSPTRTAWLLSLISLGIAAALIFLFAYFGGSLYEGVAYSSFKQSFAKGRFDAAGKFLNILLDRARTAEHAPLHPGVPVLTREAYDQYYSVIELSGKQKFSEAQKLFHSIFADEFNESKEKLSGPSIIDRLVKDIEASFVSARGLFEEKQALDESLQHTEADLLSLRRQYGLIAKDFGDFLNLAPSAVEPQGTPSVYESGVLSGLPLLSGLKDGITALPTLKEELSYLGGEVKVKGESAPKIFAAKISELQTATKQVLESLTSSEKLRLDEKQNLLDKRQKLSQTTKVLEEKLISLLFELTGADIEPLFVGMGESLLAETGEAPRS